MTADEITKLAAEVMTSGVKQDGARYVLPETMLIEMVRRIEAAEREACALICDEVANKHHKQHYPDLEAVADECSGKIRARGET